MITQEQADRIEKEIEDLRNDVRRIIGFFKIDAKRPERSHGELVSLAHAVVEKRKMRETRKQTRGG